ncbi:hypothetical protein CC2G_001296 [Coprinopsis cinerea AmutBmut pab1-1]|nr:hypothetical protein CC2G_001296 [Coprinopsis cinerea AmutBmut pab1-1]
MEALRGADHALLMRRANLLSFNLGHEDHPWSSPPARPCKRLQEAGDHSVYTHPDGLERLSLLICAATSKKGDGRNSVRFFRSVPSSARFCQMRGNP